MDDAACNRRLPSPLLIPQFFDMMFENPGGNLLAGFPADFHGFLSAIGCRSDPVWEFSRAFAPKHIGSGRDLSPAARDRGKLKRKYEFDTSSLSRNCHSSHRDLAGGWSLGASTAQDARTAGTRASPAHQRSRADYRWHGH